MDYMDQSDNIRIDTSIFFQEIMKNAKAATFFILNSDGIILDWSWNLEKFLKYEKEELVGKHFSILFIPEDRMQKVPEKELQIVNQTGSAIDDNFVVAKDGSLIWVHGESILSKTSEGEKFIIKIIFDINEKKLLEENLLNANQELHILQDELLKRNEKLNKVNKDLDTFVYTASHDLKAPINNIQALISELVSELSEESKNQDGVQQILAMIDLSLNKFRTTLSDLATTAKVKDDTDEESLISFQEIFELVKFDLKELIETSDATIHADFSKAPFINFLKKNLRSIIYNLVSNAIKYRSPERNIVAKIFTKKIDNNWILLNISDNGSGMDSKNIDKIFNMYARFHEDVEGTGVGMNIVKKILDNNGGKIEIESEIGKGSTFKIFFKIKH